MNVFSWIFAKFFKFKFSVDFLFHIPLLFHFSFHFLFHLPFNSLYQIQLRLLHLVKYYKVSKSSGESLNKTTSDPWECYRAQLRDSRVKLTKVRLQHPHWLNFNDFLFQFPLGFIFIFISNEVFASKTPNRGIFKIFQHFPSNFWIQTLLNLAFLNFYHPIFL